MLKIILLILLSEICDLTGHLFFKKTVSGYEGSYLNLIKKALTSSGIWLGLLFVGAGIVIWLLALAQTELSVAGPIDSMEYILTLLASRVFLGEKIDRDKLIGTLLVVAGILFVVKS